MEHFRNLIVIGASAGGITAINKVIAGLDLTTDAAVLVVLHLSPKSNGEFLASEFQKNTELLCQVARSGDLLKGGSLYIAPPDHHLMVSDGKLVITRGAHENKYRPSIDVLFRSAAVHYGNRMIGIILTGMLEDGTAGMDAIKQSGGICIVQQPKEAEFPGMPQSVINKIEVDYVATLTDIPMILSDILQSPLPPECVISEELKIEADITDVWSAISTR